MPIRRRTRTRETTLALSVVHALGALPAAAPTEARVADDLRDRPIPLLLHAPTALDYHQVPIRLESHQAHERLVDVCSLGLSSSSYYARSDGLNAPYYRPFPAALSRVYCRQGVARRLVKANDLVRKYGVEILVLDGFRPIALQRELWEHFIEQAKQTLCHPTEEQCTRYAGQFCSDPRGYREDDWRTWPTHNTGGAVDVTLRALGTREPLYMGGVFDDASEVSFSDYYERTAGPANSASFKEARSNRRLLYWAMSAAGFVNYPYEWWHYDFGTQMAVTNRGGKGTACYGRAALPK